MEAVGLLEGVAEKRSDLPQATFDDLGPDLGPTFFDV